MANCKLGILLLPDFYLSSLSGMTDLMQVANASHCAVHGEGAKIFEVELLSLDGQPVKSSGGLAIAADKTISNNSQYDMIYIPGFFYSGMERMEHMMQNQHPVFSWLQHQWQQGVSLAANCTGNFMLAESGLLKGKQATTTWWLEHQFRKRYPGIQLNTRALITEQERIICSGSMTACFDMALKIIERYCTATLAAHCAKIMLLNTQERSQSAYLSLVETFPSSDPVVAKAQHWLQNHLNAPTDLEELAKKVGVSQRTLIRRFKSELGIPPLTFLQNLRVETAKEMLARTQMSVTDIISEVGYSDASSFAKLFKQRTDLTPASYRKQFQSRSF